MTSYQVDVTPAVLIWARESIGLSREEAAKKLQMPTIDLRMLEEGVGDVSMPKLRRMAKVYDRPLLAFFLPTPPEEEERLPDFRLMPENHGKPWSPKLHKAYRRVMGQREVALVLSEIAEELPSAVTLRLHLHEDVETSGERVRHWLRVLTDSGIQSDKYEIFNYWAHLIENRSVLVTQVPGIELEEMRGFSIGEHPFPVIAINGKDAPRGKTFTLLHELVHILLRHGGLCDLRDEYSSPDTAANRVEWFCNGVAAAVLMPRQVLLGEQLVAQAPSSKRWNDDELLFLSKRFGVSAEAMLLRLVTLNRASPEFYRERRPDFLRLYAEAGRLQSGGPGYYKDQVRFLGRAYIQMVLDAYDRADITDPDLARYLGNMKLKNVPKLVETLGSEP